MKPSRWMSTKHTGALAIALGLAICSGTLQAEAAKATAPTGAQVPAEAGALDLRLGDLSWFLDRSELQIPVSQELEEIIVSGRRPEPLPEQRVIPTGLASLVYAVRHPTQAWRILVPDPNVFIADRSVDDLPEPPGAYRARDSWRRAVSSTESTRRRRRSPAHANERGRQVSPPVFPCRAKFR